ncbi:hypothetical protein CDL12_07552 [Handroanthus impetiginosus]|uniref:Uncharacterized protein n=1 Tax=Handroanthus impetiginosus TaxID=429701 RepID=A0A2G9HQF6_9LAMI|nr:hypothetical protein CDL12_07552 [Handroanthus impetiginosus]
MEGLIPFLIHAMKKQRPQNAYRCLSENSASGRSYHVLLAGDSVEGSSHRRTRSEIQPPSGFDFSSGSENLARVKSYGTGVPTVSPWNGDNGLRQRDLGFTSASHYQVSGKTISYGR